MNQDFEYEKKPVILVVDDNLANLQLAVSILRRKNFEIAVANSGSEAFNILEEIIPDLILLDIMMPEQDGYEVCEILKSRNETKEIPVIFLTALKKSESVVKGFEIGAVDYITKPFNKEELISRVKNHLDLKFSKDTIIKQNRKLEQLNNDKNGLLRITAHDLKNPLHGISGLLEIIEIQLSEDNPDQESIKETLKSAQNATKQADKIIRDLLDLNSLEDGKITLKYEDVELVALLKDLKNNYIRRAEAKNIRMNFSCMVDRVTINTDPDKLYRIFENLLSNSLKFSNLNSQVNVKLSARTDENEDVIRIDFEDNGPGISEEEQKLIFKKFVRLSNKPTGDEVSTGLGLSIVKELADKLHYKIIFNSKINEGTTFSVIIRKPDDK